MHPVHACWPSALQKWTGICPMDADAMKVRIVHCFQLTGSSYRRGAPVLFLSGLYLRFMLDDGLFLPGLARARTFA